MSEFECWKNSGTAQTPPTQDNALHPPEQIVTMGCYLDDWYNQDNTELNVSIVCLATHAHNN